MSLSQPRKGNHTVAKQIGSRGFYARCEVEIHETNDTGNLEMRVEGSPDWEAGARFGVQYAFERYGPMIGVQDCGYLVLIKTKGMVVDTQEKTMAMASCLAVLDAFGLQPDKVPTIEDGRVVFP